MVACSVALSSCGAAKVPTWNGRLFFGDFDKCGLTRNNAGDQDFISAKEPKDRERFNDQMCMSGADFKTFVDTYIGGCEKWKENKGFIMVSPAALFQTVTGTSYDSRAVDAK